VAAEHPARPDLAQRHAVGPGEEAADEGLGHAPARAEGDERPRADDRHPHLDAREVVQRDVQGRPGAVREQDAGAADRPPAREMVRGRGAGGGGGHARGQA
jgi:hypothetical protein